MKILSEATVLRGKRVLLRTDFNVPVRNGKITDDYRIVKTLTTLKYLHTAGAKTIIISHIENEEATLKPVFEYLKESFPIEFISDFKDPAERDKIASMKEGEFVLLENIRNYQGEKKNEEAFAKELASFGDLYVNEAFSVAHREHASVVGIPRFLPSFAGFQFTLEVKNLSEAFTPTHPFLFILGGAKFDTKLPLVKKFLDIADTVFIVGALANDIFKARGLSVGDSLTGNADLSDIAHNPKILVPVDVTLENGTVKKNSEVLAGEKILDAGPESIRHIAPIVASAKYILWNGPLGKFENGFKGPTEELARLISVSGAKSILGGGDTLASISNLGLDDTFSFVSTGGGAMLDYLANGTLPGIEALK